MGNPEDEFHPQDNIEDDDASDLGEDYPKPAPRGATAKDWDDAVLKDCNLRRMQSIASLYDGATRSGKKAEVFQSVFDAMNADQDCPQCPGGKCQPLTHVFPGIVDPPAGWVKGANGVYAPPPAAPPLQTTQQTAPSTVAQQQQNPQVPPLQVQPGPSHPITSQQYTTLSMDWLNAANGVPPVPNNSAGSPSRGLFRPTGTLDRPVTTSGAPVVSGVIQLPPSVPNVAQVVRDGGAALLAQASAGSVTHTVNTAPAGVPTPQQQNFQAEVDRRLLQEMEEARRKREVEAQELERRIQLQQQTQQAQADYEKLRRQQLLAAQKNEELAHQRRMQALQAQLAPAPASPALPASPHTQFLAPPATTNSVGLGTTPPSYSPGYIPPQAGAGLGSPMHGPVPGLPATPNPFGSPLNLSPAANPAGGTSDLEALVDRRLQAMFQQQNLHHQVPSAIGHSHNPFSLGASAVCGDKGKTKAHKVQNSQMAARLGILAQPTFEVDGNFEDVDMSKLTKILTAGYDKTGPGIVLRQTRWPHRLLQSTVPGYNVVEHKDLTFHHLMNGLISKCLSEVPPEHLNLELANKLLFVQFLTEMSFRYTHAEVLETTREMLMAWQNKQFEWTDDWDSIKERLKGYRQGFQQSSQYHTHKTGEPPGGKGGPGNGGAPGNPKKQQGKATSVNGVPKSFMKANDVCIRFNEGGCPEKDSHQNKYGETKTTLRHICGGCFAKDKSEEAHMVLKCQKHKFSSLFQKW